MNIKSLLHGYHGYQFLNPLDKIYKIHINLIKLLSNIKELYFQKTNYNSLTEVLGLNKYTEIKTKQSNKAHEQRPKITKINILRN